MELTYTGPRMQGADTTFQEWEIAPQSSTQYWQPNDVIKFMGNISQGLVDFYRTHIEFEIQVTKEMMPVGLLQIDNSAQSIFSQTILQSNQIQIERIQDYDVLAAGLTDIGFSEVVAQGKAGEGIGYNNIPTNAPPILAMTKTGQTTVDVPWAKSSSQSPTYMVENNNIGTFSPVITPQYSPGYTSTVGWNIPDSDVCYSNTINSGLAGGSFQSLTNWLTIPYNADWLDTYTKATGRAMSVRSQYNLAPQMCGYPDAPYSLPVTSPQVKNQKWVYNTMGAVGYNPQCPYETTYNQQTPDTSVFTAYTNSPCSAVGYTKAYCPQFATGCGQPFISPTVPQIQMVEGRILPQPLPVGRKTFRIPLISAILGVLIPPDQFKLIPAASLRNITLQASFNPYAFFTSGYSDVHQFDTYGMQQLNQQKRLWRINKISWVWHLYTFNSSALAQSVNQQLTRGIVISSNYWQEQAAYQLANGAAVRSTFQIPVNVESLGEVWCMFLSNEYQTKSFARKQFRLSNNIISMQFKANGNYFPLQPIQGNAGNPQTVDTTGDNWNFIEPLYLSYNFLFNTNVPQPRINTKNFAINGRIYDTHNQNSLLPLQTGYRQYVLNTKDALNTINNVGKTVNGDTAMGQSWFHQNRYVGRAIFCYSFEPYGHSKSMINGLNTLGYRQFDVTFNNSPRNIFPFDETLYVFTRANVLVKYTDIGITVLGA